VDEFLVECVLAATIDRLCFHPAKIEMIKRWRGRGGRHCPSFDETGLCNDKSDLLTKMSALGQKRTFAVQNGMSALTPKADMCGAKRDVRLVPIADIGTNLVCRLFDDRVGAGEQ
jgi:hypothetical protein